MTLEQSLYANDLVDAVATAFAAQDSLNQRLSPTWRGSGWQYYRAIWVEAAEALDHLNWAWWKAGTYGQPPTEQQMDQFRMELVDIFHFGMSDMIIRGMSDDCRYEANLLVRCFHNASDPKYSAGLVESLEAFIFVVLHDRHFHAQQFAVMCHLASLSLPRLLTMYAGKQCLNKFRWANGYNLPKDHPNKYLKHWLSPDGKAVREDNEHLSDILSTRVLAQTDDSRLLAGLTDGSIDQAVYNDLQNRYTQYLSVCKLA